MTDDAPSTQELRAVQSERVREEERAADEAATDEGVKAHERRADKAAYLARKLAEQEQALDS